MGDRMLEWVFVVGLVAVICLLPFTVEIAP